MNSRAAMSSGLATTKNKKKGGGGGCPFDDSLKMSSSIPADRSVTVFNCPDLEKAAPGFVELGEFRIFQFRTCLQLKASNRQIDRHVQTSNRIHSK